ncbi:MAG: hypothetical protein RL662_1529 [Bacteroidota bacterium]|jgi:hypothetical protein
MQNEEDWDDPSLKEYTDMQKYAFVTLRAIEMDAIGYCYRENSDIKIDSGWRFMYGDEDEDYLDNPDNTETQDLAKVLDWKPELKEIVSFRPGTEFEWNAEKQVFDKI